MASVEDDKKTVIVANDTLHILESNKVKLKEIREYIEKRIRWILVFIFLNLLNYFAGYHLRGWWNLLICIGLSVLIGWVGYKALVKVREIKEVA